MPAFLARIPAAPRDYSACSACSLCLLVCPSWRRSRDPRLTAAGLAKALQGGATVDQLAEAIEGCCLCGACDPVCPEGIDLTGLMVDLRRRLANSLPRRAGMDELNARLQQGAAPGAGRPAASQSAALLLPGPELRADAATLARVQGLLGADIADDDGDDIALALELGVEIPPQRLQQFVAPLRGRTMIAADGLLLRYLRRWLPGSNRASLGAALSSMASVRRKLGATDLYVIEPRAYHADYDRLVKYYDQLQIATGCMLNLDLQRIAIPAQGQVPWIMQGRKASRVVVESLADRAAFERVCDLPVVHIAELAEAETL